MSWEEIEECGDRVIKCPHCGKEDHESENFCDIINEALEDCNYEDNVQEYECDSCGKSFYINLEVRFVFSTGTLEDYNHPGWCTRCGDITVRSFPSDKNCYKCGMEYKNKWEGV